jgi:hypothetical protein
MLPGSTGPHAAQSAATITEQAKINCRILDLLPLQGVSGRCCLTAKSYANSCRAWGDERCESSVTNVISVPEGGMPI